MTAWVRPARLPDCDVTHIERFRVKVVHSRMNTPEASSALEKLYQVGGERLVREVLEVLRTNVPPRLTEARAAARRGDAREVARLAHSLKSSLGQVGAVAMAEALSRIEEQANQGHLDGTAAVLDGLEGELDRFLASLPRLAAEPDSFTRRRRIGIVEDNDDTRLIVRTILEGVYDVDECANGQEALSRFTRRPPDAVLLDISLPGIDGLEVLARLRADERLARIPVVALTAHAMVGDRERFLAQGFDGYASKPILDERDLLETVRVALEGGA